MKNSRRKFLKQASIATGTVSLAGSSLFSAKSYASIMGANDRVRVGIIGFSARARGSLIPSLVAYQDKMNFKLTGVSDIWNARRDWGKSYIKELTGDDVIAYRNNEQLYEDNQIDAVIISTADFQHALHTVEAANARKDAYVEKPFAETMDDNIVGLKAVEESGIVVQIGSQRRSGLNYHAADKFIKAGKFGDIMMVEMTWNVNQPARWRQPKHTDVIQQSDTDWNRYLINRPYEEWDPRKYVEYRLFWPYSSGIPGQWMSHQIDTVHWFSGLNHPRSVTANGGIYLWKDGRENVDTMTAVFDYGPDDKPDVGFQVVYSSRFTNSAGGTKEIYFSNAGELNLATNKVSSNGGLTEYEASKMGYQANLLEDLDLANTSQQVVTSANTGSDPLTNAHMLNWMECVRSRKTPNASIKAGYNHSIANIMTTAALRTGEKATFDKRKQQVMAGGNVFKY